MRVRILTPATGAVAGEIATTPDGGLSYTPGTQSAAWLRGVVEELRPYMDEATGEIRERTDAEVVASLPQRLRNQSEWAEEVVEG